MQGLQNPAQREDTSSLFQSENAFASPIARPENLGPIGQPPGPSGRVHIPGLLGSVDANSPAARIYARAQNDPNAFIAARDRRRLGRIRGAGDPLSNLSEINFDTPLAA